MSSKMWSFGRSEKDIFSISIDPIVQLEPVQIGPEREFSKTSI